MLRWYKILILIPSCILILLPLSTSINAQENDSLLDLEEIALDNVENIERLMTLTDMESDNPYILAIEGLAMLHSQQDYLIVGVTRFDIHLWCFSELSLSYNVIPIDELSRDSIVRNPDGFVLAVDANALDITCGDITIDAENPWLYTYENVLGGTPSVRSGDGKWSATAWGHIIRLVDLSTDEVYELGIESDSIGGVIVDMDFSPTEPILAAANRYGVRLWSLETFELIDDFGLQVNDLTFSSNGNYLAYRTEYGETWVVDMQTRNFTAMDESRVQYSWNTVFSLDGSVLISSEEIWNSETGDIIALLDHNANFVALSDDGRLLISGDYDGNIILWGVPQESTP